MSLIKATLRATAAKAAHTYSPSTIYNPHRPPHPKTILPASTSHRCSFSRYAARMHTTTKNTAAQANLETKRPKNDTYVSTAADPSKNVAPSHEIPDPDAMRGYPDAEERSENTLFIKSRGEKDELEDEDEDEGEEYDEDAEEARVEKILGFKPKPQIRPKGNRITDGRNVATEFGSVPQEEEEEDWRC